MAEKAAAAAVENGVSLDPVDPVQFCIAQAQAQALRIDALIEEVKRLGHAIDDMRATLADDVQEGATLALAKLANDSDHGKPYWTTGADHIGRRWFDTVTSRLGKWILTLIGGAAAVAVLVWYVQTMGGAKK